MRIIKKENSKPILTTNPPKDLDDQNSKMITTDDFETKEGKLVMTKKAKKRLGIKEEKNNADTN